MAAAATKLNYDVLMGLAPQTAEQTYTDKDTMLYALGLGLGYDPMNEAELAFIYEKNLKAFPTFPVVLGAPRAWLREQPTGIDWVKVVHGEHSLTLHGPLRPTGTVLARSRVIDIVDKGEGKGALLYTERAIIDAASNAVVATIKQTTFCRGNGGFGGPRRETPAAHAIPDRAPDHVCDLPTRPEMALVYRLNGDRNPLHAEPDFAPRGRFPAADPAWARDVRRRGARDPEDPLRLRSRRASSRSAGASPRRSIRARPSVPRCGATAAVVSFRARLVERDVIVLNNGRAEIAN